MQLLAVPIAKPEDINFILGQSHFIKTVEDLYEAIVQTNPNMLFGIAFCEASGPALVRWVGNDSEMIELAKINALAIGAGHSFIIFVKNGFPVNILPAIKNVTEVTHVYCATSNQAEIIVAETELGRAILGVVDGVRPAGVEGDAEIAHRKEFLRKIGYKL